MSFSFNASGNRREVVATVAKEAAANIEQIHPGFADAIIDQLTRLPSDAECTLVCHGHTGMAEGQQSGEISLHAVLNVRIEQPTTMKRIEDRDPEVISNPGAERFPEGFAGDAPPGPAAGEAPPA